MAEHQSIIDCNWFWQSYYIYDKLQF